MQEKLVRSAPIDIALVKSMHLTWKMRVRSAVNGFSDWQEVHAQAPEKSDIGRWIQDVGLWKYQHEPVFEMFLKQHNFCMMSPIKSKCFRFQDATMKLEQCLANLTNSLTTFLNSSIPTKLCWSPTKSNSRNKQSHNDRR